MRLCRQILWLTVLFLGAGLVATASSFAFLYEIPILDKAAVSRLSDEALVDAYIDALVELDAATIFHRAAGFNPKEYDKYKKLLRYSVDLDIEITKRGIEVPDLKFLINRE